MYIFDKITTCSYGIDDLLTMKHSTFIISSNEANVARDHCPCQVVFSWAKIGENTVNNGPAICTNE